MSETTFAPPPRFRGRGDVISAPFPWLFTGEDNLRVVIVNSFPGAAVTVHGRFLQADAQTPGAFEQTFAPSSDRLPSTFAMSLGVGSMLNCSVVVSSGAPLIGQTYVMMQVIRGLTGATVVLGCLFAGYVTAMQHLAYPGSPIESSISGGGVMRFVQGTDPAAGADILETVPTGARWELLTLGAHLVTSAAPGVRRPRFTLTSGAVHLVDNYHPGTVGPTSDFSFAWAQGLALAAAFAAVSAYAGLTLGLPLHAGDTFGIGCENFDVADNWGPPAYYVREWLEA